MLNRYERRAKEDAVLSFKVIAGDSSAGKNLQHALDEQADVILIEAGPFAGINTRSVFKLVYRWRLLSSIVALWI